MDEMLAGARSRSRAATSSCFVCVQVPQSRSRGLKRHTVPAPRKQGLDLDGRPISSSDQLGGPGARLDGAHGGAMDMTTEFRRLPEPTHRPRAATSASIHLCVRS